MVARVARIAVAPVKGLGLTHPDAIVLEAHGVAEDRRFHLIDDAGRLFNGKGHGPLVRVRAGIGARGERLALSFPDGLVVDGLIELGSAVETSFYGRPVSGRVVDGPWAAALSTYVGRSVWLVRVERAGDGVDRGPDAAVSLVSTGSLTALAGQAGVDELDGRRFRMLLEVDGLAPHAEDDWLGREVEVGEALVRLTMHVGRCAVTTHDPDTGVPSVDTLRAIGSYRSEVPSDEPLPFGVCGPVVRAGRVAVGDPVRPAEA